MTRELPPFVREILAAPPRAGEGVHAWLFRVARQLHAHLPAGEIVSLLERLTANCGRPVPRREIIAAVQNSLTCAWQPGTKNLACGRQPPRWPAINEERREAIIREGGALVDLWELSRVRLDDNEPRTEEIIDRLFPADALLCCGKSETAFETRPREAWRGELANLALIVPSPMTALTGLTQGGKQSARSLASTGLRRFLICESDRGTADEQAALLIHLGGFAPLVCAVHSGNKSLHGWFLVANQPEDRVASFFRYAVSIGTDPATWTRCQFVRMPDGRRDNGNRQTVFFLNFRPLGATQ